MISVRLETVFMLSVSVVIFLESSSWINSVSSVLSANPHIFTSGFSTLKQPGWWALKDIQPPKLPDSNGSLFSAEINQKKRIAHCHKNDVDIGNARLKVKSEDDPTHTSHHVRTSPTIVDFATMSVISDQGEVTQSVLNAAEEIKRKLVERLLRVDSTILKAALTKTKPDAIIQDSPSIHNISLNQQLNQSKPSMDCIKRPENFLAERSVMKEDLKNPIMAIAPSLSGISRLDGKLSIKIVPQKKKDKKPKPANYIRASPHENELVDISSRIPNPDCVLLRFKRKLLMRRAKRLNGLPIFDFDTFIYNYLKQTDPIHPLPETIQCKTLPNLQEASALPLSILSGTVETSFEDVRSSLFKICIILLAVDTFCAGQESFICCQTFWYNKCPTALSSRNGKYILGKNLGSIYTSRHPLQTKEIATYSRFRKETK